MLQADKIEVMKAKRRLVIYRKAVMVKQYKVSLGRQPRGHKRMRGDNKTPEGEYLISGKNPNSKFYLSLRISYPNEQDTIWAEQRGYSPGGDIMIHGLPNRRGFIGSAHRLRDWTNGCIAVTNSEIREIWKLVPVGTPIFIWP